MFAIVLVNSLPRAKYATVIHQLPTGVKSLTMSQVTARLRLEAASMATDEICLKDFYAAKAFKLIKKVGKGPKDHCHINPNGRHTKDA